MLPLWNEAHLRKTLADHSFRITFLLLIGNSNLLTAALPDPAGPNAFVGRIHRPAIHPKGEIVAH